ncbi:hypothetical protein MUY27_20185 [Mucilaginibacter sp. RS28]|uniref:BZIP transcription factor n=1 Tax=Mucilaginibacter straminoryzae TaxID=2932774 RepID=A0A9X1X6M0_9SPHI|nr:hypothetical protein [Mucilaginibacter straminoryzae]MCJ8212047.1 hypothetical protein [Mucilaginibacter straminoryzae]
MKRLLFIALLVAATEMSFAQNNFPTPTGEVTINQSNSITIATLNNSTTGVKLFGAGNGWNSQVGPGYLQLYGSKIYDEGNNLHLANGASQVFIHGGDTNAPVNILLNAAGQASYINSGNVGIGTSTPDQKLHVVGNIRMSDKLFFGNWFLGATGAWPSNPGLYYSGGDEVFGMASTGGQISFQIDGGFRQQEVGQVNYFMDKVGIGTTSPDAKLAVKGTIHAQEVKVDINNWGDYVFKPNYNLTKLSDLKTYVDRNHHLPEIPSAQEIETKGANLGELVKLQMKKIEELTLYLIEKDRKDKEQQAHIHKLQKSNAKLISRLGEIEKTIGKR